ncbi:hypothetical protein ACFQ0M_36465 [Kitasatospora aburaviensis]
MSSTMTSSSTATLPLPAATPHLRAVRSVPSPADRSPAGRSTAERWHGGAAPQRQAPLRQTSRRFRRRRPSRPLGAAPGAGPAAAAGAARRAAGGAAVVAALPPGVLPQALLAQYGAQFGAAAPGHPMVGYLVLVPAETGTPAGPAPAGAGAGGPAAVRPVRPAGRGSPSTWSAGTPTSTGGCSTSPTWSSSCWHT